MLRFFALVLVLVNCVYFAWSQNLLVELGFAPVQQTEPQRLAQQIKPDAVRLLSLLELRLIDNDPQMLIRRMECLQVGLIDEVHIAKLRQYLSSSFPIGSWTMENVVQPSHWIVYMGPYANAEILAKKRTELASLKLKFEPLSNPSLEFGLSLGGFDTKTAANAQLATLTRRGVRTARVIQERAEEHAGLLRFPAVDDVLRSRLNDLKPLLAGRLLQPC